MLKYLLPWRLADALNRDLLSERAKALYLVAFLVWPFPFLRVRVDGSNRPFAVGMTAIMIVGLISVFRANGGLSGRRLIERYVCLHTPIAVGSSVIGLFVGGLLVGVIGQTNNVVGMIPWVMVILMYFAGLQHFVRRAARST